MSGSNLRRSVLFLLTLSLLLPLAAAHAAPAESAMPSARMIQISDLGRTLLRTVDAVLSALRPATGWDIIVLPGGGGSGEGNGLDPHGKP
jgi:hypothetical protein